jgi:AraC-like DNA-binding protein
MHQRLDEPLSLQDMADIATLSPYHFNRVFRQVTGIPPAQFLYTLRLEAAKRLLLTTQLSVTEICYEVGYNSLGTFITRFTQLVGLSPGQMRKLSADLTPRFHSLYDHVSEITRIVPAKLGLIGQVKAPNHDQGLIVIGIFSTPIPQGKPVACTLLTAPGQYHFAALPDGVYYPFAAALPCSENPITAWLNNAILQGMAGPIRIRNGQMSGNADITLHSAQLTHPPLLLALPFLLAESWISQSGMLSTKLQSKQNKQSQRSSHATR